MLIAEASVTTERSGRSLVRLCRHIDKVGRAHPQMQAHEEGLHRLEQRVGDRLEQVRRRDRPTVTWTTPGAPGSSRRDRRQAPQRPTRGRAHD